MRGSIVAVLSLVGLSACSAQQVPTPHAPPPPTLGIDMEVAGGATTEGKPVSTFAAGVGFDSGSCCSLGLYLARSYLAKAEPNKDPNAAKEDASTSLAGKEITELGGSFTIAVTERLRFRMRGGLAAQPPKDQQLGRSGVTGGAAALFRVWGSAPAQLAKPAAHLDLFLGYSGWALGQQLSSAGRDGDPISLGAVMAGARISADYGVDFQ